MKKRFIQILTAAIALAFSANAMAQKQNDPVIFEVGGQPIYKSEFMREFLKSIGKEPAAAPTACTYEKRKALEEYVDVYVNFRAKLADANARRIDTLISLKKELRGYRQELAEPYLIDSATMEHILREAYERNQYAVHASHILIRVNRNASPEDTMAAYSKAIEVYNKAIKGADFNQLALEYSEDPSAKGRISEQNPNAVGNKGDLGCFTVFNMVYNFETAAYNTKPGTICRPIRTNYGYHIIKVHEKMKYYGKSGLLHIWVKEGVGAEGKIRDAYQKIMDGDDFAVVCRNYSDDVNSAVNGGLLPEVELNQIPPEYVKHISETPVGQLSEPFHSTYGWHIIKVVKLDVLPPYEEMVPTYKQRLARDARNTAPKTAFAEQCKERYGFTDFTQTYLKQNKNSKAPKVYLASLKASVSALNDSVYRKKWHYRDGMVDDMRPLFQIGDQEYNNIDLLKFIEATQVYNPRKGNLDAFVDQKYKEFIEDRAIAYADSRLELDNAEFKALMDEYRNGLMIFSYTDKMVWSKAILDSTGLKDFYATESKKKSLDKEEDENYFWNTRAKIHIVRVPDNTILAPEKAEKAVARWQKKSGKASVLRDYIVAGIKDSASRKAVTVESKTVEDGKQTILNKEEWATGSYTHAEQNGYAIVIVEKVTDPCLKSLMEARGYYINDYQNHLDTELIKTLRKQYNVVIHKDVVDEITY
ncbi:MAG: peptidylprolyl isomerase [Bacteroidales bacterium]|nr:peptidylprolyl isomerase [Bacteroidales bacterium]